MGCEKIKNRIVSLAAGTTFLYGNGCLRVPGAAKAECRCQAIVYFFNVWLFMNTLLSLYPNVAVAGVVVRIQ